MEEPLVPWFVPFDASAVQYAFFISHVGEDAGEVKRLKSAVHGLSGRGGKPPLDCFLDVHDWTIGNVNRSVIKEYLLKSAHMVVWATPHYLRTLRGWVWMELAYAELIELSLNGGILDMGLPYIVPVSRDVGVQEIERTPLHNYWQRQVVVPGKKHSITWVAEKLVAFHEQEARKREADGS